MSRMSRNVNVASEHDEQVAVCRWLTYRGIPYFAVPNGGLRSVVTATRLKAEGVRQGAPDLLVFLPHVTVALEMKTRDGGRVTQAQKEWSEFFGSRPGWVSIFGFGAQDAIAKIVALI